MKIAVIGSGISGLSAAHFLSKKYTVDLFEKDNHFGGHSYTLDIPGNKNDQLISLDVGFIVFNKVTYKNLVDKTLNFVIKKGKFTKNKSTRVRVLSNVINLEPSKYPNSLAT